MTLERFAVACQFFPPESNGPANRLGIVADRLAAAVDTHVCTVEPSYPVACLYEGVEVARLDECVAPDVDRLPAFRAHGGVVSRALREFFLSRALVRRAAKVQPTVLWVSVPSMFLIPTSVAWGERAGVPVVVDVRDLTWLYASDSAAFQRFPRAQLATFLTRWMTESLRKAEIILVTNQGAAEVLVEAGVDADRLLALPNGISREKFDQLRSVAESEPGDRERLTVTYCGLVGHNQGMATLADVAERQPGMDFTVVGAGPELEGVRHEVDSRGLRNMRFLGQRPWSEIAEVYRHSDILFAQLRDQGSLSESAVPSKIYEYMAAGRPILYSGSGIAANLVQNSGAGIAVSGEDVTGLCDALDVLAGETGTRSEMGRCGRATASAYVREDLADSVIPEVLTRLRSRERTA